MRFKNKILGILIIYLVMISIIVPVSIAEDDFSLNPNKGAEITWEVTKIDRPKLEIMSILGMVDSSFLDYEEDDKWKWKIYDIKEKDDKWKVFINEFEGDDLDKCVDDNSFSVYQDAEDLMGLILYEYFDSSNPNSIPNDVINLNLIPDDVSSYLYDLRDEVVEEYEKYIKVDPSSSQYIYLDLKIIGMDCQFLFSFNDEGIRDKFRIDYMEESVFQVKLKEYKNDYIGEDGVIIAITISIIVLICLVALFIFIYFMIKDRNLKTGKLPRYSKREYGYDWKSRIESKKDIKSEIPKDLKSKTRERSAKEWYLLGKAYFINDEYSKAIEAYENSLEKDLGNKLAWIGLGQAYDNEGQYNEAINAYKKALDIDTKSITAWISLGVAFNNKKDFDKSIDVFKRVLTNYPKNIIAWSQLGIAYFNKGEFDNAIDANKQVLKANPNNKMILALLGQIYYKKGDYNKALDVCEKCLNIDPNFTEVVELKEKIKLKIDIK